ncbi:hypothetical protein BJ508DRAFT_312116 [Ascobolus immersus RN42]|uniref:C2H2-type domain-containing protein n=1 Tax=Ascobolus immersus RN42 TaxID=1160509 RepID=A0A3N4HPQ2_ASCIM|nr:hypothetical protein BJ508DRAFT_312116 [Ascobolus immersus RN42]
MDVSLNPPPLQPVDNPPIPPQPPQPPTSPTTVYTCSLCTTSLLTANALLMHKYTTHEHTHTLTFTSVPVTIHLYRSNDHLFYCPIKSCTYITISLACIDAHFTDKHKSGNEQVEDTAVPIDGQQGVLQYKKQTEKITAGLWNTAHEHADWEIRLRKTRMACLSDGGMPAVDAVVEDREGEKEGDEMEEEGEDEEMDEEVDSLFGDTDKRDEMDEMDEYEDEMDEDEDEMDEDEDEDEDKDEDEDEDKDDDHRPKATAPGRLPFGYNRSKATIPGRLPFGYNRPKATIPGRLVLPFGYNPEDQLLEYGYQFILPKPQHSGEVYEALAISMANLKGQQKQQHWQLERQQQKQKQKQKQNQKRKQKEKEKQKQKQCSAPEQEQQPLQQEQNKQQSTFQEPPLLPPQQHQSDYNDLQQYLGAPGDALLKLQQLYKPLVIPQLQEPHMQQPQEPHEQHDSIPHLSPSTYTPHGAPTPSIPGPIPTKNPIDSITKLTSNTGTGNVVLTQKQYEKMSTTKRLGWFAAAKGNAAMGNVEGLDDGQGQATSIEGVHVGQPQGQATSIEGVHVGQPQGQAPAGSGAEEQVYPQALRMVDQDAGLAAALRVINGLR